MIVIFKCKIHAISAEWKRESKSKPKIFIKNIYIYIFEAKIEKLTSGFQITWACSSVESIQTVVYNNQMHQNENDRPIEKQNKLTPRPQ